MHTNDDQLAVLNRLRTEGQITDEEFEDLAQNLHAPDETPDATETSEPSDPEPQPPSELWPPRVRDDLTVNLATLLATVSLGLLVFSLLGMLSWLISLPAIAVLASVVLEGWRKLTLVGSVFVIVLALIGFALSNDEPVVEQTAPVVDTAEDQGAPVPGSLGIYVEDITESWNTVEGSTRITRGLTHHNEVGEYDTFIYRFGEWGRVAGAYDPDTEAVYALLVTGQLSEPATSQLYQHLCFVVAPFSQDCLASYQREGLGDESLEAYVDTPYRSEWALGEHTWRLEIEQNVLTVRVYGEDAA